MNKLIVYRAVYPTRENTNKSSTIKTTNLQNNNNKTTWKLQTATSQKQQFFESNFKFPHNIKSVGGTKY
jgi:hypothetical protein